MTQIVQPKTYLGIFYPPNKIRLDFEAIFEWAKDNFQKRSLHNSKLVDVEDYFCILLSYIQTHELLHKLFYQLENADCCFDFEGLEEQIEQEICLIPILGAEG